MKASLVAPVSSRSSVQPPAAGSGRCGGAMQSTRAGRFRGAGVSPQGGTTTLTRARFGGDGFAAGASSSSSLLISMTSRARCLLAIFWKWTSVSMSMMGARAAALGGRDWRTRLHGMSGG